MQKYVVIPGRRKVLTKNMIEESQKNTKSAAEAARWLTVCYNTYRKWAKFYDIFEKVEKLIFVIFMLFVFFLGVREMVGIF